MKEDPAVEETFQRLLDGVDDLTEGFAHLPLAGHPILAEYAPYYDDWVNHPAYDDYWASLDVSAQHDTLNVAALNIGGWYDIFLKGTIDNFTGMRAQAPRRGAGPAALAPRRLESQRHVARQPNRRARLRHARHWRRDRCRTASNCAGSTAGCVRSRMASIASRPSASS